jgi:hypothetical protein
MATSENPDPKPDDVLRRMLAMKPKPHNADAAASSDQSDKSRASDQTKGRGRPPRDGSPTT